MQKTTAKTVRMVRCAMCDHANRTAYRLAQRTAEIATPAYKSHYDGLLSRARDQADTLGHFVSRRRTAIER
jgi:hypothetical protein